MEANPSITRCSWVGDDPLMVAYHDQEWGVPSHNERHLFEMLTLEGAQAGLSWSTILRRRDGYRRAFAEFDVQVVAKFSDDDVERLLREAEIIRNRAKVLSTINNARCTLEAGSLDDLVWSFVPGERPLVNRPKQLGDLPAQTRESQAMSKALKKRGFTFVGPTICYAFMQTCGIVDDHMVNCFRARG
jgi:DNA-3-methyladenine glycosylase I